MKPHIPLHLLALILLVLSGCAFALYVRVAQAEAREKDLRDQLESERNVFFAVNQENRLAAREYRLLAQLIDARVGQDFQFTLNDVGLDDRSRLDRLGYWVQSIASALLYLDLSTRAHTERIEALEDWLKGAQGAQRWSMPPIAKALSEAEARQQQATINGQVAEFHGKLTTFIERLKSSVASDSRAPRPSAPPAAPPGDPAKP